MISISIYILPDKFDTILPSVPNSNPRRIVTIYIRIRRYRITSCRTSAPAASCLPPAHEVAGALAPRSPQHALPCNRSLLLGHSPAWSSPKKIELPPLPSLAKSVRQGPPPPRISPQTEHPPSSLISMSSLLLHSLWFSHTLNRSGRTYPPVDMARMPPSVWD